MVKSISERFLMFCSVVILALISSQFEVSAEVIPNALFGDHAVLQQGIAIPVWGSADAGEAVTVTLDDETQQTAADSEGRWLVYLSSREAGGPHTLFD
jgi:sialate O-acetylesterase